MQSVMTCAFTDAEQQSPVPPGNGERPTPSRSDIMAAKKARKAAKKGAAKKAAKKGGRKAAKKGGAKKGAKKAAKKRR